MKNLVLPNSSMNEGKFKNCFKCEEKKPPEGGIEMGQKWMCANCWIIKATRTTKGAGK